MEVIDKYQEYKNINKISTNIGRSLIKQANPVNPKEDRKWN
jgi:hypothetical protein